MNLLDIKTLGQLKQTDYRSRSVKDELRENLILQLQKREGGFGRMLVEECERVAIEAGATEMCLHAQARLEGWYGLMGYTRFGEVDYEDEGQPHIWMEKTISRP